MPRPTGSVSPAERTRRLVAGVVVLILAAVAMVFVARQLVNTPRDAVAAASALADPNVLRETRVDPSDTDHPAVKHLDPRLRRAVQRAASAAREDGVRDFWLTSGWRTADYQQELFDAAVRKHGSRAMASRWAKTPETSEHVQGRAVDVGPARTARWMSRHAEDFGLCRTYANEVWHYGLKAPGAAECPAMKPDARG